MPETTEDTPLPTVNTELFQRSSNEEAVTLCYGYATNGRV